MSEAPRVEARSRDVLRDWLAENHGTSGTVWLVTWRKGTPHHLPWPEIVRELLCWGWIDSLPRKLDAERTMLRISPRDPSSAWSGVNKAHVEAARAEGRMTQAGEAAVAAARENGMWSFLDDVERLEVPPDLAEALGAARPGWDAYQSTVKRGTLEWIKTAKRPATRERRIAEVARAAAAGERPAPFARPGRG
jgi:uncharacterized protein YdeI (YjbR/CyaY-like superfamily)